MNTVSYQHARAHFPELWNAVEDGNGPVLIRRRDRRDLAMVSAAELSGLRETVHLLRSPANAARLLAALARSQHAS